jgi:Tfp pilus assembly protein PilF
MMGSGVRFVGLVVLVTLLLACSSPEEKKASFFAKGSALYEAGDYVKARLEFKNAIQIDPKFAEAYHALALVELKDKEVKRAFGYLNKAVELNPDLIDAQAELGRLFLAARLPEKAKEKVDLVLSKAPQHQPVRLVQAALLLGEKKTAEAKHLIETLYREGATTPGLYTILVSIAAIEQDLYRAEALAREGVAKNPDNMRLRSLLTSIYIKADKKDAAEKVLAENITIAPEEIKHRLALAEFFWSSDQREKAEEALAQLAQLEPESESNHLAVSQYYLQKQEIDKAEAQLKAGLATHGNSFKLRTALSKIALQKRDTDGALAILEESLTLSKDSADPGILETKTQLASVHLMHKQTAKAEALIDAVLAENAKSIDAGMLKSQLHLTRGEGAQAVTLLRTVVAEHPKVAKGHLMLAQAHLMSQSKELAMDTLRTGLKELPASKEIRMAVARLAVAEKDDAMVEEQLEAIVKIDPKDMRALTALGDFYLSRQRNEEGRTTYEGVIEKAPNIPAGYLKLARYHEVTGDKAKAIDTLAKGYAKMPESAPILAALVKAQLNAGQAGKAEKLCREAIERHPDNAFAHNLIAQVHMKGKQILAAETALKKAIELQPQWTVPHNNLAGLYLSSGKEKAAIRNLEAAITENSQNRAAYMTLASLYDRSGNSDAAISTYEKAVAADPNLWSAHNNLAYLLAEYRDGKADLERALALARRAEELRPEDPAILDTVGWVQYKVGALDDALATLEKAFEKQPDSGVINYHLAHLLIEKDRKAEAREKLEKALAEEAAFPGKTEAEALLKTIEAEG